MSAAQRGMMALVMLAIATQLHAATSFLILPLFAGLGLLQGLTQPALYDRRLDKLEWAVMLWLLIWLLSAVFALHVQHAFALSVPVLVFALMFAVLYRATEARLHDTFVVALFLLGTWQALSILGTATQPGTPQQWIQRVDSPWLLVPNDSVWMLCLWPLWWSRARALGGRLVWLSAALLLIQAAALLVLESLLALLLLVVLALLALVQHLRRPMPPGGASATVRWRWLAAITLLISIAAAYAIWLGKGSTSMQARWQLWQAAWNLWLAHPWLGVGPHGFGLEYRSAVDAAWVDPRHTPWPHQLPLELLANTGVIAFAAFSRVCVLAAMQIGATRTARSFPLGPLPASLLAFAVVSMLEASTLRLWWWVVLALLLGSCGSRSAPNKHQE